MLEPKSSHQGSRPPLRISTVDMRRPSAVRTFGFTHHGTRPIPQTPQSALSLSVA